MSSPAAMLRRLLPALLVAAALLPAAACSSARMPEQGAGLWDGALEALAEGEFIRAEQLLTRLVAEHPGEPEGREALFYLALLHLDPRNPSGDAPTAAQEMKRYLDQGAVERRAEGVALFALARQLSLPPEQLIVELAPEGIPQPVVVVSPEGGAEDPAEVERLRSELGRRNAEIARLREELERIRRTLAPPKQR